LVGVAIGGPLAALPQQVALPQGLRRAGVARIDGAESGDLFWGKRQRLIQQQPAHNFAAGRRCQRTMKRVRVVGIRQQRGEGDRIARRRFAAELS